jgi:hypothetical protein
VPVAVQQVADASLAHLCTHLRHGTDQQRRVFYLEPLAGRPQPSATSAESAISSDRDGRSDVTAQTDQGRCE